MAAKQSNVKVVLSQEELKALIREAVRDALVEVLGEDMNPEPQFAPEIAERLRAYREKKPQTIPAAKVAKKLGFDD